MVRPLGEARLPLIAAPHITEDTNGEGRERKLRGGRLRPDGSREHVYTPEIAAELSEGLIG